MVQSTPAGMEWLIPFRKRSILAGMEWAISFRPEWNGPFHSGRNELLHSSRNEMNHSYWNEMSIPWTQIRNMPPGTPKVFPRNTQVKKLSKRCLDSGSDHTFCEYSLIYWYFPSSACSIVLECLIVQKHWVCIAPHLVEIHSVCPKYKIIFKKICRLKFSIG